jgi:carbamoyltransferase
LLDDAQCFIPRATHTTVRGKKDAMLDTAPPAASEHLSSLPTQLVRALSLSVAEELCGWDGSVSALTELSRVLQELRVLEEELRVREPADVGRTDLVERISQRNLDRDRLINLCDRSFRRIETNGDGRVYSETPGEICERLLGLTLTIDAELPLQCDTGMSAEQRIGHIEKIDRVHAWRTHLQSCLRALLRDVREGTAILPPRSMVAKCDNPYLDPLTRKEAPFDIYAIARRATNLKQDTRHILALASTGHGASLAYLGRDGTLRSSVFDRWAGSKYTLLMAQVERDEFLEGRSPIGAEMRDLLVYSYGRFPPYRIFEEAFSEWLGWLLSGLDVRAEDIDLLISSESLFVTSGFTLGGVLNRWVPNARVVTDLEHHAIHQRQAFWASGFEAAAVVTLDTCGENLARLGDRKLSGTIARMHRSGKCEVLREMIFPYSSAGLIYSIVNHHVGFSQGQEGKTMGLAPYGRPDLYHELVKHLQLYDDGSFDFLPYRELHAELARYEYERPREKGAAYTQRHCDIAYAGQAIIEDILKNAFAAALRLTGLSDLVYAGGLALNSVANEIANRAAGPRRLYIPPNPGDAGLALGCAFYAAYELAGWEHPGIEIAEYLGPDYSKESIVEAALGSQHYKCKLEQPEGLIARCLANGHIVARFSGRAEFGPRALGNRSILADPRRKDMKDYLNEHVKHREGFRPYAPSVLVEHVSEWFDLADRSPYMLRVVNVPESVRDLVPAIVHVDGTARVQTVAREENEGYWRLIEAFHQLTGVPLVLNTSFNIAGKPIVETPRDAVACFEGTEIDVLLLGDWVLSKRPIEELTAAVR